MGKHAYCILAHTDEFCLNTLLSLLDDKRNDLFLHIDKKSSELRNNIKIRLQSNKLKYSEITIIDSKESIDIRWGDTSQMIAEITLFEQILKKNKRYDYIHLLSGVDLPIKTQDYIHEYFEKVPIGSNFIGFINNSEGNEVAKERTNYYYFFLKYQRTKYKLINVLVSKFNAYSIKFQKNLKIKRRLYWEEYKKGTNWVSVSYDFVKYLVENKKRILKEYRGIPCVDEIYKQTEIYNSKFRSTIYDIDKNAACGTRLIDWKRGAPYIWTIKDKQELMNSTLLFARKFNSEIDKNIINSISAWLKINQNY